MLSILDKIILTLACFVTLTGSLINYLGNYVPMLLKRLTMYGVSGYNGPPTIFWNAIEISKSHYRDFYVFATCLNVFSLTYMSLVYFLDWQVDDGHVINALKVLSPRDESVSSISGIATLLLFTLQCSRRLYETVYLQVFSVSAKMNLAHFIMAIVHYFTCAVAFGLDGIPLFSGRYTNYSMPWVDNYTLFVIGPCTLLFIMSWYEQYKSNVILANLRKDKKTGAVVSMKYAIPRGRLFEYTSSPHRLCEILMYIALAALKPTQTTIYICIWVFSNQIQLAVAVKSWYMKTFTNYPSERAALIPYVF